MFNKAIIGYFLGNTDLIQEQWDRVCLNYRNGMGDLPLAGANIKRLPDNLLVGYRLILSRTNVTELPKGLKVGEDLFISNTKITELPDDLIVKETIYISPNMIELKNKYRHRYDIDFIDY